MIEDLRRLQVYNGSATRPSWCSQGLHSAGCRGLSLFSARSFGSCEINQSSSGLYTLTRSLW